MTRRTLGRTAGTATSGRLHEEALEHIPGGVSHNVRYRSPHPIYVSRAAGSEIWDVDGNRYVDFWNNHAASLLGHSHPAVVDAVTEQAANGLHYGAANEVSLELAKAVPKFVPSADRVRFCVTGTEATMYAVRLARAWTGRDRILKVVGGWHGGNTDLAHVVSPPFDRSTTAGLPPGVDETVHGVDLDDRDRLDETLDRYDDEIAAVIVDARRATVPDDPEPVIGYLSDVSDERGFLLILDEVVTGFRVAPGSYQAKSGIEPDLTTLGKILGGGMPVAAVAGRAEIFEPTRPDIDVDPTTRVLAGGGTFAQHPLSSIAGLTTLDVIESEPVYDHTESLATVARTGLRDVFEDAGVEAIVWGMSSLIHVAFDPKRRIRSPSDVKSATDSEALVRFQDALGDRGYFFNPGSMGNVSYAHTDEQIEGLIAAADDAVAELRRVDVL